MDKSNEGFNRKSNKLKNDFQLKEEIIAELHELDQLFNSSAIRFNCFRSIFLEHFDEYLIKRARANKRGLSKIIVGLRTPNCVIPNSRSTDAKIKDNVKAEIELFMTHMTNTMLKMNESYDDSHIVKLCEHSLVQLVNKFVYHEEVRLDIIKKAEEIKVCYAETARAIGKEVYKHTGRKLSGIGFKLFNCGDSVIENATGMDVKELRQKVVLSANKNLLKFANILELQSIDELVVNWRRVHSMLNNYNSYIGKRNAFVETIEPMVMKKCYEALKKPQYESNRHDLCGLLIHTCTSKLLSNILQYNSSNAYTTFAYPHIEQEISLELAKQSMISLPAALKRLQGPVIEAGKCEDGSWCPHQAKEVMKSSHPKMFWTLELIEHIRFGVVKSQSINIEIDDEEPHEIQLASESNVEEELQSKQLLSMLMKEMSCWPDNHRQAIIEYFSKNSDDFTVSKSSLVKKKEPIISDYMVKRLINELRNKFNNSGLGKAS